MRCRFAPARALLLPSALSVIAWLHIPAAAQPNSAPTPSDVAAQEKEGCIKNLTAIYAAIQAYQTDNKDLPNWLSDLVPHYISDANLLVCPVCRRTGKIEAAPLADPKISTSYLFEFCPVPLAGSPEVVGHTRREWKRRQMSLVGSMVPIVRCRHHNPVLNLAFDGHVYESPGMWEMALTNRVHAADLTAARLFANDPAAQRTTAKPLLVRHFAPRDTNAPPTLLDLTPFYNAMVSESWHGSAGNNLAGLPIGITNFGGVEFDVRGIVQLRSKSPSSTNFPVEIKGIHVGQKCRRLHFLHAAGFGAAADEGKQIGSYVVRFATNQMRLEIPITYGQAVRNWHVLRDEPAPGSELNVVWTGENAVTKKSNGSLRLFLSTWTNLVPDLEIESIDFVSSMNNPAPFLIAITVD